MAGVRRQLIGVVVTALLGPAVVAGSSGASVPTFTPLAMVGSPLLVTDPETDFWINAVAPADVDADGDLDLAVIGFFVVYNESFEDILLVLRNGGPDGAGGWIFTEQRVPLGGMAAGGSDLAWGDYDGDGDPDLAVGSEGETALYANDGGTLSATAVALPGYEEDSAYNGAYDLRSLTWADVDNDDDLDLLVPSVFDRDSFEFSTRLLRNDGPDGSGGWSFTDTAADLAATAHAQSAWADDDGDQDLDLLLTNVDPHRDTGFVRRYENDGGTFTHEDLLGITVEYGLADWSDHDADGDLDLLVAGNIREADGETYDTVLRVYRNDAGAYTVTTLIDAPNAGWLDIHAATWADYDSDGDVDVLVTGNKIGEDDIEGKSEIFANDGGTFTSLGVELPAPIQSIGRGGAFTWFDLENDGDLDYLVAGAYYVPGGNGLVEAQINLYRNDEPADNDAPSAPTALASSPTGDGVRLRWGGATDDGTDAAALTYDLDVRRRGSRAVATRRLPEAGNVSATRTWALQGLAPGTYDWSVRAVDSAFNGGRRASGTFTVPSGLAVTATPVGGPVTIPAGGGSFAYDVRVTNVTDGPLTFDLWTAVTSPSGQTRVTSLATRTVAAGDTSTRRVTQRVPADAAAGRYTQVVSVGDHPVAHDTARFRWTKSST